MDWHPADVVAALRKAGWSVRKLSEHYGYKHCQLSDAIRRRWPKGQRLIAEALGIKPEIIWPSRYCKPSPSREKTPVTKNGGRHG
jgi:Ner family transcriptional regulator